MSEEQFKAFLEKIQSDTSLQEKLNTAADADAVLAIAKEAGFMISIADLNSAELAEEELETASGGTVTSIIPIPCNPTFGRRCKF